MIAQFALRLVCGAALTWSLLPRPRITSGFFRVQMLVALGLLVLASLTAGTDADLHTGASAGTGGSAATILAPGGAWIPSALLAAVAYVGSVLWMLERRAAGTVCLFALLVGTWGTLVASRFSWTSLGTVDGWFAVFCETAAAATIGGSVTAMLLGHWYLTATGMSLVPLARSNSLLTAALLVRLVLSAVALAISWRLVESQTQGLWLALHWLAGLCGPLVGVVMVRRILVHRNTQSATGVLFAIVILVFIGELSATLLGRELGTTF